MPGVVMMENGFQNGLPTNHDRDTNGAINGNSSLVSQASSSDRHNGVNSGNAEGSSGGKDMVNGASTTGSMDIDHVQQSSRMNDLPDEIQHISEGYIPLGVLLSRLAQRTHNQLQGKILELAKMPVPAPALNGNSPHPSGLPDDLSIENLDKKASLLHYIQETHARWTKALVISAWSRKAPTVSKLIDLMRHLDMERMAYQSGLDYMINIKRDLTFARLPSPDLRTALQVLSTGDASWMPDLNYIEPPPLSPEEQLDWIEELDTLLSLRLNLEDHDKLPYHFREYRIGSGRVTFRVNGEFEVDLTIADEDFEKQFWFIDFRFLFTPAPAELTDALRNFLETRVNEALEKDGLQGCYNFLHEFVLTHKITEYVRQALELARGRWVNTLKIERLNRAMSIQYWTNRFPADSPKSWFILGVHSGKKPGVTTINHKSTSHLTLRWFKDNKEVKDTNISFDDAHLSTEELLKRVIGRHVEHILSSIHGRLQSKGRFVRREAALSLNISPGEPVESVLKMQLGRNDHVTVRIAPTTGFFSMTPQELPMSRAEDFLNIQAKNPTEEGLSALESLRCQYINDAIVRRGRSMGWTAHKIPIKVDELKPILKTREASKPLWFKRRGWPPQWFLMLSLSLSGDRWWLVDVSNLPSGPRIATYAPLPLSSGIPNLTDRFFTNLTVFSTAMISHVVDLKTLHQRRIKHKVVSKANSSLPPNMKLPAVFMRLSDVLQGRQSSSSRKVASWATDFVQIMFRSIHKATTVDKPRLAIKNSPGPKEPGVTPPKHELLATLADARFKVVDRSKFSLLDGNVEQDVAFNPHLGVFALRLKAEVGTTMLDDLAYRVQAIDRLVECVDAIRRTNTDIKCETITLAQVVFSYSDAIGRSPGSTAEANIHRWKASLDLRTDQIKMSLEKGNPHLRALDGFNNLLNSELGFTKVPQYLAFTLPVLKGLDAIEDSWRDLEMNDQGHVEIFTDHLDWFNIRYTLPGPKKAVPRLLHMQVRLQDRRGGHWWLVQRRELGPVENPEDEFKTALSQVWGASDRVWINFVDSAASEANDQVVALLKAMDAAIRHLATQPASPSTSRQAQAKPQVLPKNQAAANRARTQLQQQQQGNSNVVVLDD